MIQGAKRVSIGAYMPSGEDFDITPVGGKDAIHGEQAKRFGERLSDE